MKKSLIFGNGQKGHGFKRIRSPESRRRTGRTKHPLYKTWEKMLSRCLCPGNDAYRHYGGRGITVCEEWVDSFEAFLRDMGEKPGPEYTIERNNNNDGYRPGNCSWAKMDKQAQNRRGNRNITIDGVTKCRTEWLRHFGIKKDTFDTRIRLGWDLMDAVTVPASRSNKYAKIGLKSSSH